MLYLYGQQRTRAVSFVLLSRMGLGRRGHRRAIALEIGVLVATAVLAGLVPATVAAWVVVTAVDVLPRVGPPPELLMPWTMLGALLLVASAPCLVAAWASQRAADRARPDELLRTAD